jgi:anti-sigma regulatory factor (Ser/Thr protein kinase)
VLFFNEFDKLKGIWEAGSLEMEIQQQKLSALLASNVSTMVSSQNKSKTPVSEFFTNINHHSYNKSLVRNRFAFHTAGR